MYSSLELFTFVISLIALIFGILCFNIIFSCICKISLKKHFPENWLKLQKEIGKPIKIIRLTLIRFGNEKKCCGTDYSQSIPVKLLVYKDFLVFTACGQALVVNNFNHSFISFLKTQYYSEFLGKKIAHPREDLIIFSQICSIQFLINKNDILYLKNYIKEIEND